MLVTLLNMVADLIPLAHTKDTGIVSILLVLISVILMLVLSVLLLVPFGAGAMIDIEVVMMKVQVSVLLFDIQTSAQSMQVIQWSVGGSGSC